MIPRVLRQTGEKATPAGGESGAAIGFESSSQQPGGTMGGSVCLLRECGCLKAKRSFSILLQALYCEGSWPTACGMAALCGHHSVSSCSRGTGRKRRRGGGGGGQRMLCWKFTHCCGLL